MSVTGRPYDVFVSYAHADGSAAAEDVERELDRAGLSTFKDTTDILVGDVILQRLSDAISQSTYFIMLMTPRYFASGWCKQEVFERLTKQLSQDSIGILPVRVFECDVPSFIAPYKWIDLGKISMEECCHLILRRIRSDLAAKGTSWQPTKFPNWLDQACEIGSLARRSATHILRNEQTEWHRKQLVDLYYKVCKIRTDKSSRIPEGWDELLEELQNSVYGFRDTEKDRTRIERARTALRDKGQSEFR